ncbi:hypothetical protein HK102_001711 [Quaeritorhiza haematococci]|nr:hypothetical protein HK102_001711 [Quaeritorhiza haematococci]
MDWDFENEWSRSGDGNMEWKADSNVATPPPPVINKPNEGSSRNEDGRGDSVPKYKSGEEALEKKRAGDRRAFESEQTLPRPSFPPTLELSLPVHQNSGPSDKCTTPSPTKRLNPTAAPFTPTMAYAPAAEVPTDTDAANKADSSQDQSSRARASAAIELSQSWESFKAESTSRESSFDMSVKPAQPINSPITVRRFLTRTTDNRQTSSPKSTEIGAALKVLHVWDTEDASRSTLSSKSPNKSTTPSVSFSLPTSTKPVSVADRSAARLSSPAATSHVVHARDMGVESPRQQPVSSVAPSVSINLPTPTKPASVANQSPAKLSALARTSHSAHTREMEVDSPNKQPAASMAPSVSIGLPTLTKPADTVRHQSPGKHVPTSSDHTMANEHRHPQPQSVNRSPGVVSMSAGRPPVVAPARSDGLERFTAKEGVSSNNKVVHSSQTRVVHAWEQQEQFSKTPASSSSQARVVHAWEQQEQASKTPVPAISSSSQARVVHAWEQQEQPSKTTVPATSSSPQARVVHAWETDNAGSSRPYYGGDSRGYGGSGNASASDGPGRRYGEIRGAERKPSYDKYSPERPVDAWEKVQGDAGTSSFYDYPSQRSPQRKQFPAPSSDHSPERIVHAWEQQSPPAKRLPKGEEVFRVTEEDYPNIPEEIVELARIYSLSILFEDGYFILTVPGIVEEENVPPTGGGATYADQRPWILAEHRAAARRASSGPKESRMTSTGRQAEFAAEVRSQVAEVLTKAAEKAQKESQFSDESRRSTPRTATPKTGGATPLGSKTTSPTRLLVVGGVQRHYYDIPTQPEQAMETENEDKTETAEESTSPPSMAVDIADLAFDKVELAAGRVAFDCEKELLRLAEHPTESEPAPEERTSSNAQWERLIAAVPPDYAHLRVHLRTIRRTMDQKNICSGPPVAVHHRVHRLIQALKNRDNDARYVVVD